MVIIQKLVHEIRTFALFEKIQQAFVEHAQPRGCMYTAIRKQKKSRGIHPRQ